MAQGLFSRKSYIGDKFGRLTIIEDTEDIKTSYGLVRTVRCLCDCGEEIKCRLHGVKGGNTKSCGCLKREVTSKTMTTHGLTKTVLGKKIYVAWSDIKRRCYDENHSEYKRYGSVGISLQENWLNDPLLFYDYVSKLPMLCVERSLDRVDNAKNYVEGNLRWATDSEQTRNQGKQINNTSGVTGITWYSNRTGGTRVIAWWYVAFKCKSKSFSVKKYGLLPAFKMACDHRDKMIAELNAQGAGYTENHGK